MKTLNKILPLRMWNRFARSQRSIQKTMLKKADWLRLCLLTIDMMVVIREHEKFAISLILPDIRPMRFQLHDYALLYLDLPAAGISSGFYRLQLAYDEQEVLTTNGMLLDESGQFVRMVRYQAIDLFAPIVGNKTTPEKRLTVFETFNFSNNIYLIGGTHADGQAFVITF